MSFKLASFASMSLGISGAVAQNFWFSLYDLSEYISKIAEPNSLFYSAVTRTLKLDSTIQVPTILSLRRAIRSETLHTLAGLQLVARTGWTT